jgi:nucleotide-binding universal stress UspA family protein
MDDVKRILVISRSTRYCHKAIHYGVSLAKQYGAQLYIIHVIDDPFSPDKWDLPLPYPYLELMQEDYKKKQQEVKKELDKIVALEKAQGVLIEEFLRDGNPADEILKVAQDKKIDLIIMLAHEESRLEHLFLKHDKDKLIREMPCSILLVKYELF